MFRHAVASVLGHRRRIVATQHLLGLTLGYCAAAGVAPAVLAAAASEDGCRIEPLRGENYVVCKTRSAAGKKVQLELPGTSVSRSASTSRVCSRPPAPLRDAILWMPDHGHGSAPTRLSLEADGCTTISNMVFSMVGRWQVKLRFADNDRAIVELDVQ